MDALSKEKVLIAQTRWGQEFAYLMRLGYARCSTDEQEDALQAQIARLTQAGCDRVISELVSGRKTDRPGILEAMALVKRGLVEELLIVRVDRLGRDAAHADELLALCALQGVTVRALDGGEVDTASPQGFLMARLMTTMAEVESRMLSQRVRKQFTVYRQEGRHLRRRVPFGYSKADKHLLVPDPVQWPQALRVIEELRTHGSFTKVANHMPDWCEWTPAPCNLQGWFVNPIIRGHVPHHHVRSSGKGWKAQWKEIHYDRHEALISEGEWRELANWLQRTVNKFQGGPTLEPRHGLTGLLRCASCGTRMRRNSSAGVAWWRCRHRLCNQRGGVREEVVLPVVLKECLNAARELAAIAAMPPDEDPQVALKRKDLEQLQMLATRNPALQAGVDALQQEIEALTRRERPQVDLELYEQYMLAPGFFEEATAEQQRGMFGLVLQEVQVGPAGDPIRAVLRSF